MINHLLCFPHTLADQRTTLFAQAANEVALSGEMAGAEMLAR